MKKPSLYIIIFKAEDISHEVLGFSLMNSKKASLYMKAVSLLANNEAYISNVDGFEYNEEFFDKLKISRN